jgi:hypothetical protein
MRALPLHEETSVEVEATPEALFERLDDHSRLSSHMQQSSWMMGGGSMRIESDDGRGRRVGSRIQLSGRAFGIPLSVEETVMERVPPLRKVWETDESPRLLVIGPYRMGFEIARLAQRSRLCVFIDYALPDGFWTRWLGRLLGGCYARWCVRRMVDDAVRHFAAVPRVDTTIHSTAHGTRGGRR